MQTYRWEVAPVDPQTLRDYQRHTGLSRLICLILASRGIDWEQCDTFLTPMLSELEDPYALPGTRAAAERLWQAIERHETILIHGDYDTDGITATALTREVLASCGGHVETFLPHRMDDGYGLTRESIDKACREHHSVLVTVDCGITSLEAVEAARGRGIDVIVTDHHEPSDEIPAASAVIDPKLSGASARVRELAGVGVAFKLCHAFLKYGREHELGGFGAELKDVLDLVALGTVADIVPLVDENRRLVKPGLETLSRQLRPGVRALCEIAGVKDVIRASDIAFRLAPRINASGRMGDPSMSLRLLESSSMSDALPLARALEEENRRRQQLEMQALEEAEKQIAARCDLEAGRTIVVWGDAWHQGVLGIVAARLTRQYHRPAIVLTRDSEGALSGSGRSIDSLNLVVALEATRSLLTRYGGHPMAAGLSLHPDNVEDFAAQFEETVHATLPRDAMRPSLDVCGEATLDEVDDAFLAELTALEPFGQGNPPPVLLTRSVLPERIRRVGQGHSKGILRDEFGGWLEFIAFGQSPDSLPEPPWDVVYRPQLNSYNGKNIAQASVMDVHSTFADAASDGV